MVIIIIVVHLTFLPDKFHAKYNCSFSTNCNNYYIVTNDILCFFSAFTGGVYVNKVSHQLMKMHLTPCL